MKCPPKRVVTELRGYLRDMGFEVSGPEEVYVGGTTDSRAWRLYVTSVAGDLPGARVLVDAKTCNISVEEIKNTHDYHGRGAYWPIEGSAETTREVREAIAAIRKSVTLGVARL